MGRRLSTTPPARSIPLLGGVMFGVFFVIAFTLRRLDVSTDATTVVAGIFAYAFLAAVALILVMAWRAREGTAARRVAERFLIENAQVRRATGTPERVVVEHPGRLGGDAGQLTLPARVVGPLAEAQAQVIAARLGSAWEVLGGELEANGVRARLLVDAAPGDR